LYFVGVLGGAQIVAGTVRDNAGNFQQTKDKRFCVSKGRTISMIEVTDALYNMGPTISLPEEITLSSAKRCGQTAGQERPLRAPS
jgi:hypothetical protein